MKITAQELNSITLEVSKAIETQTDIVINADNLYDLNHNLALFLQEEFGADILEEEEEFEVGKFLLIPRDFTSYGVVAFAEGNPAELHGPFDSETLARDYIFAMRKEYDNYERFGVCKIELPSVGNTIYPIGKEAL